MKKKYDFNKFTADFCFIKTQSISLDNVNKHSSAWGTLILKPGHNRLFKKLARTPGQSSKTGIVPVKPVWLVSLQI